MLCSRREAERSSGRTLSGGGKMARTVLRKAPGEAITASYNATPDLAADEALLSATTVITDSSDTVSTAMTVQTSISGLVTTLTIAGGVEYDDYKIALTLVGDAGTQVYRVFEVRVRRDSIG